MRGAQAELVAVAVLNAHHLGAVGIPAAGLVPQLAGLQHGHQHLLGAGGVHLLADDGLHLV